MGYFKRTVLGLVLALGSIFPAYASDVPLPAYDIKKSVAPCAIWLGKWDNGKWNKIRPGVLVVTSISGDGKNCKAKVIHAWGTNPKAKKKNRASGFVVVTATIKGNTLHVPKKGRGSKVTYRMTRAGTVYGRSKKDRITLRKS